MPTIYRLGWHFYWWWREINDGLWSISGIPIWISSPPAIGFQWGRASECLKVSRSRHRWRQRWQKSCLTATRLTMMANQEWMVEYPHDTDRTTLRAPRRKIVGVAAFHVGVLVGASDPFVDLVRRQIVEYSQNIEKTGPIKKVKMVRKIIPTWPSLPPKVALQ